MSYMKQWAMELSEEMGFGGEGMKVKEEPPTALHPSQGSEPDSSCQEVK